MQIKMSIHEIPTYCHNVKAKKDGQPWYYDILGYVTDQRYPDHATENDCKTIQRMAISFILKGQSCIKKAKTKCF